MMKSSLPTYGQPPPSHSTKGYTAISWLEKLTMLNNMDDAISCLLEHHPALASGIPRHLAILGSTELAASLITPLATLGINVVGIFDHNPHREGKALHGVPILAVDALSDLGYDIPIVIATHRLGKAQETLASEGFTALIPFPVLQFVEPGHFPAHPFYSGVIDDLLDSRERLWHFYKQLPDSMSQATFDAIIGFRLTFNPGLLNGIVVPFPYCSTDIIHFENNEFILDGGAFNGDTAHLVSELTDNQFRRMISVEPSEVPFQELCARFAQDKRVEPVKACLYDSQSTLYFDTLASRGSAISATGMPCSTVTIDSLVGNDTISFIKLNIEGAETKALHGARECIRRHAPKLAIALYHTPQDLWQIPELIHEIRNDYQLFLRQHDSGIIETVLYAIHKKQLHGGSD